MSAISLSASILFHLVCNLQVILFDDSAKLLGRELDVLFFIDEHMRVWWHNYFHEWWRFCRIRSLFRWLESLFVCMRQQGFLI